MVPCYFIEYGNEEIAKIQLHHSKKYAQLSIKTVLEWWCTALLKRGWSGSNQLVILHNVETGFENQSTSLVDKWEIGINTRWAQEISCFFVNDELPPLIQRISTICSIYIEQIQYIIWALIQYKDDILPIKEIQLLR